MLNVSPWNLLFVVLNLLILAALMKKFLYKPVLGIIEKRQNMIDDQFAQAEVCKKEAEELKAQYAASISDAKAQKEQILREAKAQASEEYNKILENADQEASKMLEEAKKQSLTEKENAIRSAESEIAKLAVEAASKIVGQSGSAENDAAIYEEFLRKAGE